MRNGKGLVFGLIAALGCSLVGVSQASATVHPATICLEDGSAGRIDHWSSGQLENDSTTSSAYAMCGLRTTWNKIDDDGIFAGVVQYNVSPLNSIKVRVYDGSSSASLSCTTTRRRMDSSGATYAVSSSTDSVGPTATEVKADTLSMGFSSSASSPARDYYYNVSCLLPARGATTSKIYAIEAPYGIW